MKLPYNKISLLNLVQKGANAEGWVLVSKQIWPLVMEIPAELVRVKTDDAGKHFVRLTDEGKTVLKWS